MTEARIVRAGGGKPIDIWEFVATGETTGGHFDFMIGEVPFDSGPPLHIHHEQYDSFFVLIGQLTIQANDEVFVLGPGDFVTVPPGVPHTFNNSDASQGPVRAINIMTPGGFDKALTALEVPADERLSAGEFESAFGIRTVGAPIRQNPGTDPAVGTVTVSDTATPDR